MSHTKEFQHPPGELNDPKRNNLNDPELRNFWISQVFTSFKTLFPSFTTLEIRLTCCPYS